MSSVSEKTLKILFAQSGNRCAFPGCVVAIIDRTGAVTGEICHIHAKNPGGPRFNKQLDYRARQSEQNLILLCRTHHKVVDDNTVAYSAETLQEMKMVHVEAAQRPESDTDGFYVGLLVNEMNANIVEGNIGNVAINSPGATQVQTLNIRQTKGTVVVAPPPDSIGASLEMSSYIQYLIERYNKYASSDKSRGSKFNYGVVSKNIEHKYGARWKLVSQDRFESVCNYLIERIEKTRIAKANKSKRRKSYSTFQRHLEKLSNR